MFLKNPHELNNKQNQNDVNKQPRYTQIPSTYNKTPVTPYWYTAAPTHYNQSHSPISKVADGQYAANKLFTI